MERYNRWQALAITQTSVLVSLLSALSVAGLGASLSLVQNKEFIEALVSRMTLVYALSTYSLCLLFSSTAVLSRTMDFRLTAREVRKRLNPSYSKSTTIFGLTSSKLGKVTWFCVWISFLTFCIASLALAYAVGSVYFPLLTRCGAA